jgi:copper chaperone CopZ
MIEFKALHVPALTEEVAISLETGLKNLPGVDQLKIKVETQEVYIVFDENRLEFRVLVQEMAKAGFSLQNINAALLKVL